MSITNFWLYAWNTVQNFKILVPRCSYYRMSLGGQQVIWCTIPDSHFEFLGGITRSHQRGKLPLHVKNLFVIVGLSMPSPIPRTTELEPISEALSGLGECSKVAAVDGSMAF